MIANAFFLLRVLLRSTLAEGAPREAPGCNGSD
jgi:hypothetical protein